MLHSFPVTVLSCCTHVPFIVLSRCIHVLSRSFNFPLCCFHVPFMLHSCPFISHRFPFFSFHVAFIAFDFASMFGTNFLSLSFCCAFMFFLFSVPFELIYFRVLFFLHSFLFNVPFISHSFP